VYANYGLFTLNFLVLTGNLHKSSAWPMSSATLSLVASLISDVRAGSLISAEQSSSQAAAAAKQAPPGSKQAEEPAPTDPELERRLALLKSVGEECVTEPELRSLLKKPSFILYDGFEPSGRMHIAQGVFKAMNVNKCTAAGGTFIFWVADWFALMNDKMGGDLERIKIVGQYLIHVWTAVGMDMTRVKFMWCADEITKHARGYWTQALDIARRFKIDRLKRCCQIMGRLEDSLTAAQILYPIMQCTDIFFLKADICQLGVDQRKVNMLAREYCDSAGIKLKPIILSHHMLYGLSKGQAKMSKSNKESAIFMEDTSEDVARKITNAFCPRTEETFEEKREEENMQLVEDKLKNPCLDYVQHIIFCLPGAVFTAGGQTYTTFAAVREAFLGGTLSEADLKAGLIGAIDTLLAPVRSHFQESAEAKRILELIIGWMQEPKSERAPPLRRLALLSSGTPTSVVFAPLPSASPSLESAVDTLRCLAAAPTGEKKILWLCDWSAFTLNCLSGGKSREDDHKAIAAANDLFVAALRALAPSLMAEVTVVLQSEALLANSSDYWISVINAGRVFQLSRVRAVDEACDEAGQVLAALMHVADVLATGQPGAPTSICAPPSQLASHLLACEYMQRKEVAEAGLAPPKVLEVPAVSLRLKAGAADAGGYYDVDGELLLFDAQPDVQRKMKKAFCEPGNVAQNPVLSIVEEVVLPFSGERRLVVQRKEENGGHLTFEGSAQLRAAFASGDLHPGDFKPSVRDAVDAVLERVRAAVKADPELGKAQKEVEKVAKRVAKKK
jgi:tyrosyl-tRNA synthetase